MEDKDEKDKDGQVEDVERLELDQLDVSSMTIGAPKAPRLEQKQDKAEGSPEKVLTARSILAFVSKKKIFICTFLSALLVASAVVYLFLTKSSSGRPDSGDGYAGNVVYVVSSSIADRHYVRFKLSVPFKDNKEKADLMQKMPKIKEKLSISGTSSGVVQSIKKKDFKTLKKHILKIVNELTSVPIEVLNLEELALDPTVVKDLHNTS